MTVDAVTGEIVPAPLPDLITAASPGAAAELQRQYHELCKQLLDASDFQQFSDGQFKTRSAWRKLAVAFNVSTEIIDEEETYDDDGRIVRAKFKVRAIAPNGRYMDGIGLCSKDEKGLVKTEHVIVAIAHTRAINRACADLFGLGEVSYEEVSGQYSERGVAPAPRRRPSPIAPATSGAPSRPKGDPAAAALGDALSVLPESVRIAFRDWRRAKGYEWPPANAAILSEMALEVDRLAGELEFDQDTYEQ